MKKGTIRPIPLMLMLNIVTCGWYYIYWVYKTSSEIKYFMESEEKYSMKGDLNPALEILLGLVTCGLYFKYWYYKYGKIVYKKMPLKVGLNNTEDKTLVLVLIDIAVSAMLFFNVAFNTLMAIILFSESSGDPEDLWIFLRIIPTSLIYIVNISSLIMQDKLNNIWKKADQQQ